MSRRRRDELARQLRLMVITDRELAGERGVRAVVEAALRAGATAVQLREKGANIYELYRTALELGGLARRYGALFLVNDRFDVALASGADGVHVGDDDLEVQAIRRCAPRDFIIGRSADTEAGARAAEAAGADYLGVGSVFGTRTKADVIGEAIGTDRLARVAAAVSIPVLGIGGVDATNAGRVVEAGAVGVAVVSAIMAVRDPARAASLLLESMINSR